MHTLIQFLLNNENPTVEQLITQSGSDVAVKEPANIIQFCFMKFVEDYKNKEFKNPDDVQNVFKKLLDLLLTHKKAFTDPIYIATIFHSLGESTYKIPNGAQILHSYDNLLRFLLVAFDKNKELINDKALSTLCYGLGRLKENNALASNDSWQCEDLQNIFLDIIVRLLRIKPSAQAIATVIFGISKLKISIWTDENKKRLDKFLVDAIAAFLDLEQTAWSKNYKPNAQEISNLLYAIAQLAKQDALIPLSWQAEDRQEKILYPLIRLINKKEPTDQAISQIFYALGKLGQVKCLKSASVFWLIKPLIQYKLKEKVDYRTVSCIFVALGRLAEGKFLLDEDWKGQADLFNKLLNNTHFSNAHDIPDFFLSLGRLAEAGIMTKEFWQQNEKHFSKLITQFTECTDADAVHKQLFFAGMQKLSKKGFNVMNDKAAKEFTPSASNSPLMTLVSSALHAEQIQSMNDVNAGSSSQPQYKQ